jgi:alkylated DNA repair dioxygenase AlkB
LALSSWIATLDLKPFEFHGYLGNRRIASFGFRYDYSKAKVEAAPEIPSILLDLRERVARFAHHRPDEFVQAMATEYAPGAGIGWHKDKAQFGEIVGVSLLAPARFRLRRKMGERWERATKIIAPRSAYLLSGQVRGLWEHSIPAQEKLRYSITFRTLAAKP